VIKRIVDGKLLVIDQAYELGRCIEDLRTAKDWANTSPPLQRAIAAAIRQARAEQRVAKKVQRVEARLFGWTKRRRK
jgi:hypothetical protein